MKKKLIGIFVCMLLIATVLPVSGNVDVESNSMLLSSGNTLYVGGNGTGNYTRIQDAIDNSSNGDTVFVYDDSSPYYENVSVDKSINLIGENRNTTVIDGHIDVLTNWVNISEFTIQRIDLDSCGNNTISGNTLRCIGLENSHNNIISNNIIGNRSYYHSIGLSYSCNNIITDNKILDSAHGIDLSHSSNNIITGNNIISNSESHITIAGIDLFPSCNNNIITGNNIISNAFGIILGQSINNNITGNNIISNLVGILVSSTKNIIEKNNFIGNKRHAYFNYLRYFWIGNHWDSNYWDNWIWIPGFLTEICRPKIIFGRLGLYGMIPWVNFDRHPARVPYGI